MPRSCLSCIHWDAADAARRGACRRYAPRGTSILVGVLEPELIPVWPLTSAFDHCGEWRPFDGGSALARRRPSQPHAATVAAGGR